MDNHSSTLPEQTLKLFGFLYDIEREVKSQDGQQSCASVSLKTGRPPIWCKPG